MIFFTAFINLSYIKLWKHIFHKKINYYLFSLTPLYISLLFSLFYPKIVNFIAIIGVIVVLSNGFLFPILIYF